MRMNFAIWTFPVMDLPSPCWIDLLGYPRVSAPSFRRMDDPALSSSLTMPRTTANWPHTNDAVGEIGELQRTLRHGKVQHHVLIVLHNGKFSRIIYSGWSPAHWIIESEDFHVTSVSFCPPTYFRRWRWSSLTLSPHFWECLAAACRVPLASPGYDRVSPKASDMQDDQLVALLE